MTQSEFKQINQNASLVCTWDDQGKCLDCELQERLDYRWKQSLLIRLCNTDE